jgi:hypothetical protein
VEAKKNPLKLQPIIKMDAVFAAGKNCAIGVELPGHDLPFGLSFRVSEL